jgi:hypothetical protein
MGENAMATRLEQLRKTFRTKPVPKLRRSRSEAQAQRTAQLAKRKIEAISKAREMLRRVEEILADGEGDHELRRMRDSLVEELWLLRHTRAAVNGKNVVVLQ